jgi:hypothetical protein
MCKKFLGAIGLMAIIGLVVATAPAFTADSGAVQVSITAQAPAAPCLTVTPGSVDFGTLPFSRDNGTGLSQINADGTYQAANPEITFCGTATGQNLLASTTPATSPGGSWIPQPYDGTSPHPCPGVNQFYFSAFLPFPALYLTETPAPALQSIGGPPKVFALGTIVTRLSLIMPCQGSNGAGETKTLTATFMAVLP